MIKFYIYIGLIIKETSIERFFPWFFIQDKIPTINKYPSLYRCNIHHEKKKRYYLKKYRIFNLWSKFQTNRSLHRSWFHGILWTLAFPKTPFKPGLGRAVDWHERRTKLTRITSTNRAVRLHRLVNVSAMPINHLAPVSIRRTTPYRHQSSRLTTFSILNLHQWFTFPLLSELFHNFFFSIFSLFSFDILSMIFFFFSFYLTVNKILLNYFTQFSSILFSSSLDAPTIFLSIIFHLNVSIFLNYLTIPFLHSLSIRNDIFPDISFQRKRILAPWILSRE